LRNGETVLTDRKGEFILNLAIAGDSLRRWVFKLCDSLPV
jgi:hypothetical protein